MRIKFIVGRIAAFNCAAGKSADFIWDSETPGLGIKASPGGSKFPLIYGRDFWQ